LRCYVQRRVAQRVARVVEERGIAFGCEDLVQERGVVPTRGFEEKFGGRCALLFPTRSVCASLSPLLLGGEGGSTSSLLPLDAML
jgi:chemotaxis protein CheY-P-specific phosphatase CheC